MPAASTLRKSRRLALRAEGAAAATAVPGQPVCSPTPTTVKFTRKTRSAPARQYRKKIMDSNISNSDTPLTDLKVQEAFLTPVQRRAMEGLALMKNAHDKLSQEMALVKRDRDRLFPVRHSLMLLIERLILMLHSHFDTDCCRRSRVSRVFYMLSLYARASYVSTADNT